jgi:type IV secretion system protein VirD4
MSWPWLPAFYRPKSSPILLGRYWNTTTNEIGSPLPYDLELHGRHIVLIAPNGSGKFTRILAPSLLSLENHSLLVIDPKGEMTAVTADYRSRIGDVVVIDPFDHLDRLGVRGLPRLGFNPLSYLNPQAPTFYDDAAAIGDALIKVEGNDPHWPKSARALIVALLIWVQMRGVSKGSVGIVTEVRRLLTAPEVTDKDKKLVSGLRHTARLMVAWGRAHPENGGWQMASLASRFMGNSGEMLSIRSTADTQTEWMLSELVSLDLATQKGVDFAALRRRPTTIYVVLPAEELGRHSIYLRLVITTALRVLLRTPGRRVTFVMDEFHGLGKLEEVERAWAEVRGYRVAMLPVLQSIGQLKGLYREDWETFVAQAGAVVGFAPNDMTTARLMSERSGEKGVLAMTFNEGDGQAYGNQGSMNQSSGEHYQLMKRRHLLPQEVMDWRPGYGRIWMSGMGSLGIPMFAPNYWKLTSQGIAARAQRNPYYDGVLPAGSPDGDGPSRLPRSPPPPRIT